MSFKRIWDETCPREWDRWDHDGTTYVIQDLPLEDDEEAFRILYEDFLPEAGLWNSSNLANDLESIQGISDTWRKVIKKRMSLASYAEKDGHRRLVALNLCLPKHKDDVQEQDTVGKKLKSLYDAINYAESKARPLEALGLELALSAFGLVVVKDYRGKNLGYKVLAAREAMCRSLDIKGTTTMFTSIPAQKLAARAGFKSIAEIPIKEFGEIGLDYPKDDERIIKIMIKRYE